MDDFIEQLLETIQNSIEQSSLGKRHALRTSFVNPELIGAPYAHAAIQVDTVSSEVPTVYVVVS